MGERLNTFSHSLESLNGGTLRTFRNAYREFRVSSSNCSTKHSANVCAVVMLLFNNLNDDFCVS